MKLISETVEQLEYITEDVGGKKSLYIHGPFLVAEQINKNGRVYPMRIMEREVERYMRECIKENRAYGELNHPATPTVNLDRVALLTCELDRNKNTYFGKAKITTSTPMGAIAKALIDEGANLGVSSRGVGSLKPSSKGYNEVQEDFRLCVAADLVSDPSAPGAFVQGIMENASWILDPITGTWLEEKVDLVRRNLRVLNKEERELRAIALFEELMADFATLK